MPCQGETREGEPRSCEGLDRGTAGYRSAWGDNTEGVFGSRAGDRMSDGNQGYVVRRREKGPQAMRIGEAGVVTVPALVPGTRTIGIIAWRHELPVVPFRGEWAV